MFAFRPPGLADVAPVQDQPVMGVVEIVVRNDLHQPLLDLVRRLAGCEPDAVADTEDMRVDGHRGMAEGHG